jgi:alkanesulfonate monooxygenase SsuD/methylene tetrahydromethanopterin reductase-like flavin-dependent oxidoreductase (luciferase family)
LPDDAITAEYLVDHHWLVGSPETVARKIRDLYELVGGFGTLLVIAHEWPDFGVWDRSTTLLKEQVLPRLADLGAPVAAVPA